MIEISKYYDFALQFQILLVYSNGILNNQYLMRSMGFVE